jgi:hypothetical protein
MMTGTGVSLNGNMQITKGAMKNGNQRKKERQEAQATKGKEEDKVEELHRPSFRHEIDTSRKVLHFCLKWRGLR